VGQGTGSGSTCMLSLTARARSSAGRASGLQPEGHRFDPDRVHSAPVALPRGRSRFTPSASPPPPHHSPASEPTHTHPPSPVPFPFPFPSLSRSCSPIPDHSRLTPPASRINRRNQVYFLDAPRYLVVLSNGMSRRACKDAVGTEKGEMRVLDRGEAASGGPRSSRGINLETMRSPETASGRSPAPAPRLPAPGRSPAPAPCLPAPGRSPAPAPCLPAPGRSPAPAPCLPAPA
jgi:hypothetical protein